MRAVRRLQNLKAEIHIPHPRQMEACAKKVTGESEVVKMADNKEIGRIGQRRYGGVIYEEFLHELRGKRGIEAYREMSENDDVVGAILFAIEMLVRQTDWNVEPGGDSQADIDAAEFVESCMNDMQNTWIDRKSTRLNSSHSRKSRMPSSA